MSTKSFCLTGLAFAVTILVGSGRSQGVAQAATASSGQAPTVLSPAGTLGQNVPQRRAPSAQPNRMMTPFDRVIAPQIREFMKQNAAAAHGNAAPRARAQGSGVGGSNVNFPGFTGVPFTTIEDGDANPAYNSVSADFNNDGKMDVATIKTDGVINVILNPGTFANIKGLTPITSNNNGNPTSLVISSVVVADMNGDGFPDLIGQDLQSNAVVVWIGKGDGTFGPPNSYPVTLASGATWFNSFGSSILVGDFNGDGAPDIATLNFAANYVPNDVNTIISEVTLVNDGNGRLKALPEAATKFHDYYQALYAEASVTTNDGMTASGIAFVLDDDGFNNGYVGGIVISTMASKGDGTFQAPVEPTTILINDFILAADASFVSTNLTAKSSGKLQPPGTPGSGVATTDLVFMTGDGAVYDAPFTTGNPSTARLLVGFNTNPFGGGVIPPPTTAPTPPSLTSTPLPAALTLNVADMNGDGLQDLVVYSQGSIAVFPNAGAGVFTAAPVQMAGVTPGFQQPQPASYDGGSYNSLVNVDLALGEVGYYQNLGTSASVQSGQFLAAPLVTGTNTGANFEIFGGNLQVFATADVDGDGVPDLLATSAFTNNPTDIVLGIRKSSGAGNQTSNYTFTTAVKGQDINNVSNGLVFVEPLAISNASSTSLVLVTAATTPLIVTAGRDGKFSAPVPLNFGPVTPICPVNFADVGDVNGDGIPDLVFAYGGDSGCNGSGSVSGYYTLLGNGDGTFKPGTFTALGSSLYMVKLINFGGAAGNLDLAAIDKDSLFESKVYVVPNKADGSGTFNIAKATIPLSNYLLTDLVVGDYNSDGKQDLTLTTIGQYNPSTSTLLPNTSGVLLLPGNGDYTFGKPTLTGPPNWPIWGSYADFNGDGAPDLALLQSYNQFFTQNQSPAVQILPNLGGGTFGPAIDVLDSYVPGAGLSANTVGGYTFVGPFTNSGGSDLLVTAINGTAEFVNRGVTTLALTSSSATPGQGTAVTLTATLSQVVSAGEAGTGSIAFTINGTSVGSTPLTNGVATLTTTTLAVGSDVITATFAGDANHNQASSSLTVNVAAVVPAFALTTTPATLTLGQGATGTVLVSIASNSTFNGVVQVTCTGAPAESSCTLSPTSVTLVAGQSASLSIVVATTPPNNTFQAKDSRSMAPWTGTLSGLSIAGLMLLIWPKRRRLPNLLSVLAIALLTLGAAGSILGCSSGGAKTVTNQYPGTTAGIYPLTITATSGALTQTQTVTLTVTP